MAKSDTATDQASVNSVALQKEGVENDTTNVPTPAEPNTDINEKSHDQAAVDEATGADLEEVPTEYPQKWRLTLISVALCLAVFCMALDNTIIATAIPRITDEFQAVNDIGWYGSSYLLTTCAR